MAKSRNQNINIRLSGKTLAIFLLYSMLMFGMGTCARRCGCTKLPNGPTAMTAAEKTR